VGYDPPGLSYKAYNLLSHPDHNYIWYKGGEFNTRGVIPHLIPEVNFLMVEIPTLKPYVFMIRVTRQIKCLIAQSPGIIPHPLPEVNFLMVEIPTLKPYIFMIRVTKQIKCLIAQSRGVIPRPLPEVNFGISTIKKFTSGMRWGITPRGQSY
jgi:hypothetical protein